MLEALDSGRLTIGESTLLEPGCWLTLGPEAEIRIGSGCFLNKNTMLAAVERIEIGDHVMFANGCFVGDGEHRYDDPDTPITWQGFKPRGPVRIGDNVWFGVNCVVTGGVEIGDRAVIGANSVVTQDVPAGHIAAGVPAKVIRAIEFKPQRRWVASRRCAVVRHRRLTPSSRPCCSPAAATRRLDAADDDGLGADRARRRPGLDESTAPVPPDDSAGTPAEADDPGADRPRAVEDVVAAVLTGSETPATICDELVTPEYVKTAYGDREGCIAAQDPGSLAESVQVSDVQESGETATAVARPVGGPYDGVDVEVSLVAATDLEGAWLVDSLFADVPAGP